MKTRFKLILLALLPLGLWACDDDHSYFDDTPREIAYSEIAGCWQLTQWNGAPLASDLYFYITLNRKEHTFEIYQNFDSAKSRFLTGTYTLKYDIDGGNTISGIYDHASGDWNHSYLIDALGRDTMTWIVTDDPSDVSVYGRCESVPEEIVKGTRSGF